MTRFDLNEFENKAQFYFSKKITVHIETYRDKFYNGLIIEISKDLIILNDRVLGEIPISFNEIKVIDKFLDKDTKEVKE